MLSHIAMSTNVVTNTRAGIDRTIVDSIVDKALSPTVDKYARITVDKIKINKK